jgi:hypothetical protein
MIEVEKPANPSSAPVIIKSASDRLESNAGWIGNVGKRILPQVMAELVRRSRYRIV